MNAPVNTKEVIIEESFKWELNLSLKEPKQYNNLSTVKRSIELIITLDERERIQTSTLDVAMKIIEWLYFENLENLN